MSYDLSSVDSIDQLFKRETCEKMCPQWQVTCHCLPCYHCCSADIDENIQVMDGLEHPDETRLVIRILNNELYMGGLNFTDEEMRDFLERVNRHFRVLNKQERLCREAAVRTRVLMQKLVEEELARAA